MELSAGAIGLTQFVAGAIALFCLSACADLHLDQGPDQVIQRTEGEDNFAVRQQAGPTAARVLPYALLSEQSYDPRVYAAHKVAPRETTCSAADLKDCDATEDRRAARWLSEWRYVWSCDGPEECKVRTPGRNEPVGGLGVQVWARKGARCPEAVIAFRGTTAATRAIGNPISTGPAQSPHLRPIRSGPRPYRRLHRPYRTGSVLPAGLNPDRHGRAFARGRTGAACGLFRSADPARLRLRSLDGDRILFRRSAAPRPECARPKDRARLRTGRGACLRPPSCCIPFLCRPAIHVSSASASTSSTAPDRPAQPHGSGQRFARVARGHEPETKPMVLERCGREFPKAPTSLRNDLHGSQ